MTDTTAAPARAGLELPYTHVDDHFIDGAYLASTGAQRNDVVDPATEEVWASVPNATEEDLDRAVGAAERAFAGWAARTPAERAQVLLRAAEEIETRREPMALTNTRENGTPLAETRGAAANAAGIFRYFAPWLEAEDVRPFPNGAGETVVHENPVGVCALIAPWNFPINLVVAKLAPALLAGCTVVIKPASPTPLSVRFVVDALTAAGVPAGVVNLVTGNGRMGDRLVRHPAVRKVAFTGCTPVGRRIAAACGEQLKPVTLELGGKSSAIVLPDADLEHMSSVLLRSCLRNTGQTCYISTRILDPESRYDEVVEMVGATVAAAPQGDPLEEGTVFGPMANRAQYDVVMGYLETARAEGARVVTGGGRADRETGFYVAPTVLADVTPEMTVAREEIFGPVITVLRYRDVDEAVALANNTPFGLGGIVFSADEEEAQRVARRVNTGSVGINFFASNHAAPFGGRGDSGLGVEFGVEGLSAYLTYQSVHRGPRG
ncbi:aldehyde dehydrogenase [Kocuria flava]|uniref:Aldehyde dehydrogenase n=1 Tax=Kocuria flava TaxID=446860 RepID=A0A0U3HUW8_9MICC|nr:aldehyde dehydrogenase family protein [Kocuria flava]ALU39104.1 aldehyde dehydrogenase [Kocuria flava]GEO90775.1 aldehyde dehydrogenase [Kocuria flava]